MSKQMEVRGTLHLGPIALAATLFLVLVFSAVRALAAPPPGYYDTVDTTNSATLRATLHVVIDDHTRFPYTSSSTDTWDILEQADEDPNNTGNILDVYRNASYAKAGGGNTNYNREHSWPKSYGFPTNNSSNYPYTDCHHLFLADSGYNSSRSNKPYRFCSAACTEKVTLLNNGRGGGSGVYPGNSNWTTGSLTAGTWETWAGRRGDVARALFYMDVRYEGGVHGITGAAEPDLILTDNEALIASSNTGANESVGYMGMLSVLLQWHIEDPVDAGEQRRNDVVFSFQGNRNPFIDHPEWVDCLFNATCNGGGGGGGPAGDPWINELHYDNSSSDTGEFVEIAGAAGADLAGWQVVGYNGNGGGTYKTVNLSGIIPDQGGCMGTLSFTFTSMQNGAPDGLALVDGTGAVIEFISYEGSFTATNGPASGMTSVDIGVSESGSTPVGDSLQLAGTGSVSSDFTWQAAQANTAGQPNTGQTFDGCGGGGGFPDCNGNGIDDATDIATGTSQDCDGDGVPDECQPDSDGDGVIDPCDGCPNDINKTAPGVCGCGVADVDSDGDGVLDCNDGCPNDAAKTAPGACGCGVPDTDTDGDGVADCNDGCPNDANKTAPGACGCGVPDTDTDGDGTPDCIDGCPNDAGKTAPGACGCGVPDTDTDGDGVADCIDNCPNVSNANQADCDGDGIGDACAGEPDCNANGIPDSCDISSGTSLDANANGIPDECEGGGGPAVVPWINELHYDNSGKDTGEFVEIAGPAGTDLAGWQVVGYNGNGGKTYKTVNLSGIMPDQGGCMGTLSFNFKKMQNGAPDGLALIDNTGAVVEFISYEGSFTANNGPASGMTSVDIGVSEAGSTPVGRSLQLSGTGSQASDFTWQAAQTNTSGQPNAGQTFTGCGV